MATAAQTMNARKQTKQKPKIDYKEVAVSTLKEFQQDDLAGLAAESAYHILFSIFPLAIFGAAMSGIVNRVFHLDLFPKIMNALTSALPPDASSAISKPLATVLENQHGGLLSFGIIAALWSGSNAVSTFIKGLNRDYDVEETRPFWKAKGIQLLLTLFLGLLVVVAFVGIAFGGQIGSKIADKAGLGSVFNFVWNVVLRWPLVIIFVMIALAVLYWVGPNVKQKFQWISPGALIATIIGIVAIYGFGFYVSKFGSYNKTYGTLGGIIILMTVLYILSLIVLLGGELNSELAKRYDPETIKDIARHPEKDKGEQIYADKAPKKKPADRETDLKGAMVRGDSVTGPVAAPDAKVVHGNGEHAHVTHPEERHRKIVNYRSGQREEPPTPDPNAPYRMTAAPRMATQHGHEDPPSKRAAVGLGLLGMSAVGMAVKRMLKK